MPADKPYRLSAHGSAGTQQYIPRFRKLHPTRDEAAREAARVDALRSGSSRAAHPFMIDGPHGLTPATPQPPQ